jgi:3-oxoacyl-[acyl-carrier-protein] synthase-3
LPVRIAGTGLFLPETNVTNQQLAQTLDTSDEWIASRTGIRERRRLAPDQATSDMCIAAARPALETAGVSPDDVDAVIVATYTYDQPLPSTALIVKDALGIAGALTLDITQAACVNGLQALLIAAHLLQSPAARTVLLIAADCASRVTDPEDRTTGVFFGDAATALILTRAPTATGGVLGWHFGSQLSDAVQIPAGGSRHPVSTQAITDRQHYLKMDGRAVWDTATRCLPDSIAAAAEHAGLPIDQITHFFLHQANINIINATLEKLEIPPHRAPITLHRLGNTGSAAAFTALHHTHSQQLLRPGDIYMISAIGAGFQWGSLCLRHT